MQFIKVIPWKGVKVEEDNNISSVTNNVSRGPLQKTRSVGLFMGQNIVSKELELTALDDGADDSGYIL